MDADGVIVAITATIVAMLLISTGFIVFIVLFHRSTRRALEQRQAAELAHLRELADLEHEIRDGTMRQVGMELHDGVVQELTLVKLQLDKARKHSASAELASAGDVLVEAIDDLRTVARNMTSRRLHELGLVEALRQELARVEGLMGISTEFQAPDREPPVPDQAKMVLVRIAQEFFQNTLRHAAATQLGVRLAVSDGLSLCLTDNGRGFDPGRPSKGTGLLNMERRARSIGARTTLTASPGQGTRLLIELPADG